MTNMAQPRYCGIDFGTSNSTVAVPRGNDIVLAPVEGAHETIPSAIFFSFSEGPLFGRRAIQDYTDHEPGRLMRALKSILGYGLFHEKTRLQKQNLALSDVLGLFVGHLKARGETCAGHEIDAVVLGRPVQFIEGDASADQQAQDDLEAATRKRGFKHISFQYEPIAAALEYEDGVRREELVLIVDIGGGTADFSVVRVSPQRAKKADRGDDILANRGIRVGGTDFDRMLSMHYVMPHFGLGSLYGEKKLEVPRALFLDLSTWSRINFLYNQTTLSTVRSLRRESHARDKIERLLHILEHHDGHRLIETVERAKIELTAHDKTVLDLHAYAPDLRLTLNRSGVAKAVAPGVGRIVEAISATLGDAGLTPDRIDTVFMTGGSSLMPAVQKEVSRLLKRDDLASGDMFGAVGRGLGLEARRRFA